jgi:hypothetical protein
MGRRGSDMSTSRYVVWVVSSLVLSVAVVGLPARASAQTLEAWAFRGTVTSYATGSGFATIPELPVGRAVRGQVIFDTAAQDGNPDDPTQGNYDYIFATIGFDALSGLEIGSTPSGTLTINVYDDYLPGGGAYRDGIVIDIPAVSIAALNVLGYQVLVESFEEALSPPAILSGDTLPNPLPAPFPDVTSFSNRRLEFWGFIGSDVTLFDVTLDRFGLSGSADLPLIPSSKVTNPDGTITWNFSTLGVSICVVGCWVDPPTSSAFTYQMTNSAQFTSIADFPTGFGTSLVVSVGGAALGTFGPGDSFDFPGGGVQAFEISGIDPAADLSTAVAFPLQLVFDSPDAEFGMTSTVPGAPALGWVGSLGLGLILMLAGAGAAGRRLLSR